MGERAPYHTYYFEDLALGMREMATKRSRTRT